MKVLPRSHLKPWPLEPQSMIVFGNKVTVALVSWDEVMLEQSSPYKWNGDKMDIPEGAMGRWSWRLMIALQDKNDQYMQTVIRLGRFPL